MSGSEATSPSLEAEAVAEARDQRRRRAVDDPEAEEDQDRDHGQHHRHVAEHVVPHLVPHHEEHLRRLELGEQGVPEHDPLGVQEAGHVGVHGVRVDALGDLVDAAALDARPIGEREDLGLQRPVLHRPELVEQRVDPDRGDDHHQDHERHREQPGVDPPAPRAFFSSR